MSVNVNFNQPNSPTYAAGTPGRPVTYSNYQTGGVAYGAPVRTSALPQRTDSIPNQGSLYRGDSIQSSTSQQQGATFRGTTNVSYQAPPQTGNQMTYSNYPAGNVQRTTVVTQPNQQVRVAADPHQSKLSAHSYEEDHEEKKGCSPSNACWGLLGLLGLIGLILGILFGVGVIGRQDTVIEKIGTNGTIPASTNGTATTGGSTTTTTGGSTTTTTGGSTTTTTTNGGTKSTTTTTTTTSSSSNAHRLRLASHNF